MALKLFLKLAEKVCAWMLIKAGAALSLQMNFNKILNGWKKSREQKYFFVY